MLPPAGTQYVPSRIGRGVGWAGHEQMLLEQGVDHAVDTYRSAGEQDEVVGHAFELGERVRRQDDRDALVGHRGDDRGHEVVPGHRVE